MRLSPLTLVLAVLAGAGCQESAPPPPADPSIAAVPEATVPTAPPARADPPLAAAGDTLAVVFFGDSLTAGYGLSDAGRQAYPALVGEALAEAGVPARVVNAGNSGETSAGGLRRIDWILKRTRPDVFVLALGANDGLRGLDPGAMRENLAGILDKVRAVNPDARFVVAGMEALPNFGAEYTDRYRAVFPALADTYGAAFIPFLLDGVAGVPALNQGDGVHPTAEGQRILARTVAPVVVDAARAAV